MFLGHRDRDRSRHLGLLTDSNESLVFYDCCLHVTEERRLLTVTGGALHSYFSLKSVHSPLA